MRFVVRKLLWIHAVRWNCRLFSSTLLYTISVVCVCVLVLLSGKVRSYHCFLISRPLLYLCSKLSTILRDLDNTVVLLFWNIRPSFGMLLSFLLCVMFATHYKAFSCCFYYCFTCLNEKGYQIDKRSYYVVFCM